MSELLEKILSNDNMNADIKGFVLIKERAVQMRWRLKNSEIISKGTGTVRKKSGSVDRIRNL